jgi:hypothetical protein
MFIVRGAVAGLGVFLVALIAVGAAPLFRTRAAAPSPMSSIR